MLSAGAAGEAVTVAVTVTAAATVSSPVQATRPATSSMAIGPGGNSTASVSSVDTCYLYAIVDAEAVVRTVTR
jgi:hypothetical protein